MPGDLVLVHAGVALTVLAEPDVTTEPTGFLYPFIDADERDAGALLVDLAASAEAKMAESSDAAHGDARAVRGHASRAPGRRWRIASSTVVGCSRSATAAAPPTPREPPSCSATRRAGRSLPAMSLVDDRAVLTALANDVGFELVFSRQIIAHARPGDIAIGFSTSGDSVNVLRALDEATRRGLLTIGLCGYEGGAMASATPSITASSCASDSVHRIQETQAALVLELWSVVQRVRCDERRPGRERTPSTRRCDSAARRRSSTASKRSAAASRGCSTMS